MDPQKLSQLDPKLRDAYQRVMGTSTPQPQTPPSQTQTPPPVSGPIPPIPDPTPAPTPTPAPEPKPIPPEPTPPIQEPSVPKGQPAIQPEPPPKPPVQASNFDQMNSAVATAQTSSNLTSPAPQTQTIPQKKKSNLMPILIGIAILVFIAVYALFWTKIFNFKLPFLP